MYDALSAVVEDLRAGEAHHVLLDLRAPWSFSMDTPGEMAVHVLLDGQAWLHLAGEAPIQMGKGDLVILPTGLSHGFSDGPQLPDDAPSMQEHLQAGLREEAVAGPFGGSGAATRMMSLRGRLDPHAVDRLGNMLPGLLHITAEPAPPFWLAIGVAFIREELQRWQQGNAAILARLADILLVYCLRHVMEADGEVGTGILAGLADPALARALAVMHRRPDKAWTLETLAREAGMSRALFAERFRQRIGQTAMEYLTGLRMQRARQLMLSSDRPLASIAAQLGYQSESAFNRAFRRMHGESPGAFRRRMRD